MIEFKFKNNILYTKGERRKRFSRDIWEVIGTLNHTIDYNNPNWYYERNYPSKTFVNNVHSFFREHGEIKINEGIMSEPYVYCEDKEKQKMIINKLEQCFIIRSLTNELLF